MCVIQHYASSAAPQISLDAGIELRPFATLTARLSNQTWLDLIHSRLDLTQHTVRSYPLKLRSRREFIQFTASQFKISLFCYDIKFTEDMFGTSRICTLYFWGVVAYVVSLLTVVYTIYYTSTVILPPPKHSFAAPIASVDIHTAPSTDNFWVFQGRAYFDSVWVASSLNNLYYYYFLYLLDMVLFYKLKASVNLFLTQTLETREE